MAEDRNQDNVTPLKIWASWRPPSAVAEDRNITGGWQNLVVGVLAAAVRGGRGSQLRHRVDVIELDTHWRLLSAAAEDRNVNPVTRSTVKLTGGGRPRGWPRIAIAPSIGHIHSLHTGRPMSAAAEDRNLKHLSEDLGHQQLAATVDGGRGSQLRRNAMHQVVKHLSWRPPWTVAEDRNDLGGFELTSVNGWRPSSGMAEDRNPGPPQRGEAADCLWVAAILRDGRGSQRNGRIGGQLPGFQLAAAVRGGRESQQCLPDAVPGRGCRPWRSPGAVRPRIATTTAASRARP